jgi:hypothetical protein
MDGRGSAPWSKYATNVSNSKSASRNLRKANIGRGVVSLLSGVRMGVTVSAHILRQTDNGIIVFGGQSGRDRLGAEQLCATDLRNRR